MIRLQKSLLAATLLATLGAGAFAQMPPAGGPGAPGAQPYAAHHGPMDPARQQEMRARMEKRMQERLEFFKFKLKITPAQEGAWSTWVASIKPTGQRMQRPDRAAFEHMTTPERIDQMRAMRNARQAEMDRRFDATKAFYAQLNPEQRQVFDSESLHMLGHHRHGGHREGGWEHKRG